MCFGWPVVGLFDDEDSDERVALCDACATQWVDGYESERIEFVDAADPERGVLAFLKSQEPS